jgi:ketosteroid isomerase-like protein
MGKRMLYGVAVACVLLWGGLAGAQEKPASCATDCLAGLVETLTAALKAADVDKAVSVYLDSEEVMAIQSNGRLNSGIAGIREMYASAFKELKFLEVSFDFGRTWLQDDYGFAYFRLRSTMESKADGTKWELYVQATWVLKKVNDRWFVQFEHFSPIENVERVRSLDPPKQEPESPPSSPDPEGQKPKDGGAETGKP